MGQFFVVGNFDLNNNNTLVPLHYTILDIDLDVGCKHFIVRVGTGQQQQQKLSETEQFLTLFTSGTLFQIPIVEETNVHLPNDPVGHE